jgi:hypothetical protein
MWLFFTTELLYFQLAEAFFEFLAYAEFDLYTFRNDNVFLRVPGIAAHTCFSDDNFKYSKLRSSIVLPEASSSAMQFNVF